MQHFLSACEIQDGGVPAVSCFSDRSWFTRVILEKISKSLKKRKFGCMVSLLVYESGPFFGIQISPVFSQCASLKFSFKVFFFNICCGGLTYLPKLWKSGIYTFCSLNLGHKVAGVTWVIVVCNESLFDRCRFLRRRCMWKLPSRKKECLKECCYSSLWLTGFFLYGNLFYFLLFWCVCTLVTWSNKTVFRCRVISFSDRYLWNHFTRAHFKRRLQCRGDKIKVEIKLQGLP